MPSELKTTKRPLVIWALSDGAPGHWSQTQGIVDALSAEYAVVLEKITLRVRSSLWKRIARLLLPWLRSLCWLPRIYDISLPAGKPGLVLSSGGNTLLANALLARHYAVPNAYSGSLKGYSPSAYRVVFTVVPQGMANNCVLPLPPVPEAIMAVPALHDQQDIAVLIGGDGAGNTYTPADWQALAMWLKDLASTRCTRLLITTSRRTGADAEAQLKALIPAGAIGEAVWWSEEPRPCVRDFLARSGCVVVTEDSLTMVAESIYSGRPVFSVRPAISKPNANDETALQSYVASGLLQRVALAAPSLPEDSVHAPVLPDVPGMIRAVLTPWIANHD